jgi:hypothetical protein
VQPKPAESDDERTDSDVEVEVVHDASDDDSDLEIVRETDSGNDSDVELIEEPKSKVRKERKPKHVPVSSTCCSRLCFLFHL